MSDLRYANDPCEACGDPTCAGCYDEPDPLEPGDYCDGCRNGLTCRGGDCMGKGRAAL